MSAGPYIVSQRRPADPRSRANDCIVYREAFATLERATHCAYEIAPPMMCDRCEAPSAPWQIAVPRTCRQCPGSPCAPDCFADELRSCSCPSGPVDPIPAAGAEHPDFDDVRAMFSLPESGCTITLPNGDVIEVEKRSYDLLERDLPAEKYYGPVSRGRLGMGRSGAWGPFFARVLAAWNVEYGVGIEERA